MRGWKKVRAATQRMVALGIVLMILASWAAGQNGQKLNQSSLPIVPTRSMGPIVPSLIRISSYTNFFLTLGDQIGMTVEQRREIEELAFGFHRRIIQLAADKRVAEAELNRLLAREEISLKDVRMKLKEIEAIYVEMQYREIETAIEVINRLSHKQHVKIILAIREQRLSDSFGQGEHLPERGS